MYRVGDADRERGLALLRRCYAEGRLSVEELADRAQALSASRTSTQMRRALRDLPDAVTASELVPRLDAFRASPLGVAVARRAARVALAATLLALWMFVSLSLLLALGVWELAADPSTEVTAGFVLVWVAITWLAWRFWRRGAPGS